MNKVILMGRLTRDPDVRYSQNDASTAIARYSLAVDRRFKREGDQQADFPSCVAFGKGAEFAEKYLRQGIKIVVTGRLQTGSYTNKEGVKVYTTEVVVEEQEFAESKATNDQARQSQPETSAAPQQQAAAPQEQYQQASMTDADGFMQIPDGLDDELPFN